MYSVDLLLDKEQVKCLKQLALDKDLSVRGLVTKLVVGAIDSHKTQRTK